MESFPKEVWTGVSLKIEREFGKEEEESLSERRMCKGEESQEQYKSGQMGWLTLNMVAWCGTQWELPSLDHKVGRRHCLGR